jgi:hypothetical protein
LTVNLFLNEELKQIIEKNSNFKKFKLTEDFYEKDFNKFFLKKLSNKIRNDLTKFIKSKDENIQRVPNNKFKRNRQGQFKS